MGKRTFTCGEVSLTHSQMLELRSAGRLNLGINNDLATQISNARGAGSQKTTSSAAFHFWNWVAVGVFIYSIYLSFTSSWWWFIPGFIAMRVVWAANKKGNSENLLDSAMIDEGFYERVRSVGGWLYQMEEDEAMKYKTYTP